MSLTKKDKEEIVEIIKHTLTTMKAGELAIEEGNKAQEIQMQIDKWNKNAISTGLGFKVAPTDFELDGNEYFTWDEAKEIEEKYLIPNGWRLPTTSEWYQLVGRFGIDEKGNDDAASFRDALHMTLKGWRDDNGQLYHQGAFGSWWSTSATASDTARVLNMNATVLDPQSNYSKLDGFTLRCVSNFPEKEI